jgi:TRAP-type mannitol/chloroaromatic compound transport system substrate-binding protein
MPSPIPERRPLEPTVEAVPTASRDRNGSASGSKGKLVAAGVGVAVVVAAVIGFDFSARTSSPPREAAPPAAAADSKAPIKIMGENGFGSGDRRTTALQAFAKTLSDGSSARIQFEVLPSGPLVKSLQAPGQTDWGSADAVWVSSSHLYGQHPAFALVGEPPFGPDPAKYVQWRQSPKVKAIVTELYEKIGVMGVLCGVTGPNADLWSRKKIAQPADLKGLKTRAVGLTKVPTRSGGTRPGDRAGPFDWGE